MNDDLGDRCKRYEEIESGRRFLPLIPVVARIDGRSFSSFTNGMDRPYDKVMSDMMIETTKRLVEETNAVVGYTQSDEISLAWHSTDIRSQVWFDGRIQKMTSQLAAQATLHFNRLLEVMYEKYYYRMPTFDARVWQVPNRTEAVNMFVWREWDATKNSITMAASHYYSHAELQGKNGSEKQEMLFQKGVNWNNYPTFFKRGTYVQRKKVARAFTADEIDKLPPKHLARTNPGLLVERSEVAVLDIAPLTEVPNREDVLFDGAMPL
jgi:tRNA(His) 5'-end guanylyltransferase